MAEWVTFFFLKVQSFRTCIYIWENMLAKEVIFLTYKMGIIKLSISGSIRLLLVFLLLFKIGNVEISMNSFWKHINLGNSVTRLALSKAKQRPFHSRQTILLKTEHFGYLRPLNSNSITWGLLLFPGKPIYTCLIAKVLTSSYSHQAP